MGLLPDILPGYSTFSDAAALERIESAWHAKIPTAPGRNIRSILDRVESGEIKALLVFGSNPVKTFHLSTDHFSKLAFLMVAELFPTETAEAAHVVLPATSFAEKSGTVTNTCGQVQILKKTMRKAGTRSDLEILLALAQIAGAHVELPFRRRSAAGDHCPRAGLRHRAAQLAGGPRRADAAGGRASGARQQRSGFFIARFTFHIRNSKPV